MDTTLAINIPIAVYAYNRHKLATDPKAVKRIGFYDKRKVLTETKFQKYYVKATAIASRAAFKNDPIARGDDGKPERSGRLAFTYDKKFRVNKDRQLQNETEDYTVYVPIKYYKPNYTQVTGTINGLLSMKNRKDKGRKWFLYNGTIPKEIRMEYATLSKEEQCAYYNLQYKDFSKQVLEKLKIKMPSCIERDGDPAISPVEEFIGSTNAIAENLSKDAWLSCGNEFIGMERIFVAVSHFIVMFGLSYFSTAVEIAIVSWNVFRSNLIKKIYVALASVFETNSSSEFGYGASAGKLLFDMIPIIKPEDKAALLQTLSGILKSTGVALQKGGSLTPETIITGIASTVNTTAVATTSSIVSFSQNLMALLKRYIPYIVDMLKPRFQYMYTMFQNWTSSGTFTATAATANATANATTTAAASYSYIYARLGLKAVVEYLTPLNLLRIANLGYFMYNLSRDEKAWPVYESIVCTGAKALRVMVNYITGKNLTKIYRLFNKTRSRRYQYQLLEGNKKWELAEKRLMELNAIIKIETQPRMVLQESAIIKAVYSENQSIETSEIRIGNTPKTWVPYVYVVATGEAEINNKMQKVWYFYDYNYYLETPKEIKIDPNEDLTIWRVPETIRDEDDLDEKQVLSNNIPTETGGPYCTYTLNGRTVSGVPLLVFFPCAAFVNIIAIPYMVGAAAILIQQNATLSFQDAKVVFIGLFSKNNQTKLASFVQNIERVLYYLALYTSPGISKVSIAGLPTVITNELLKLIDKNWSSWMQMSSNKSGTPPTTFLSLAVGASNWFNWFLELLPCLLARAIMIILSTVYSGIEYQGIIPILNI